jgi:GAF domain-containing protein/anti-sigma regulatory factor (Ser/Thr protein kinase)
MGRRAKPTKVKAKAKQPLARKAPKKDAAKVRELETRLVEALEQQTATAEILRVISSTQTDLGPVFDTIVRNAGRVCDAVDAVISLADGADRVLAAHWGPIEAPLGDRSPLTRGTVSGRAILDAGAVHVEDLSIAPDFPEGQERAARWGHRTTLAVPLLRESRAIGSLMIRRVEVRPFSDRQIAMLQTFAHQAVIAIENVRLFTELQASNRELTTALDTQTATSDILRVISRSQTDVQPVFDAILVSAVRLLGAFSGSLTRIAGDQIVLVALTSTDAAGDAAVRALFPQPLHFEGSHAQVIRERAPLNVADAHTDPRLPEAQRASARVRGYRSQVGVPLLRHDEALGAIVVARREPGGFTDDEIALLQTFADQAVIAIENARLLSELQQRNEALTQAHAQVTEALEQQTATSEILRVISRSQTDVQPVFDTIVRSAVRLCDGLFSALFQFDGELVHSGAQHNFPPEGLEELHRTYPTSPNRGAGIGRAILERAIVHMPDVERDPEFRNQALSRAIGMRSGLYVPMLREGVPMGAIMVARAEPGPFSDNEVELLKTFADQAVIAVENVRLFTELQASNRNLTTALDTQTATSDILRVISHSRTDVQPVFDAIVASAVRLLGAHTGLLTQVSRDQIELAALTTSDAAGDAAVRASFPTPLHAEGANAGAIRDRAPLNIADTETDPRVSEALRAIARARGYRSLAGVPLLRQDEAVGSIAVTRREPGGFTDDEIALLKTFADQAVIAIENARLLSELQEKNEALTHAHAQVSEALEQQTATSEILRVIASSPTDIQPVFDAITESAARLCEATDVLIHRVDGQMLPIAASVGSFAATYPPSERFPITRSSVVGRAVTERKTIHVHDLAAESDEEFSVAKDFQRRYGHRTVLTTPLMRKGMPLGAIWIRRTEVRPFTDRQIKLLETLADQAVIAIENVRLFTELQASNRELTTALDTQTATSDILRVISRSQTDVQPVFDAIVHSAVRLLDGHTGTLTRVAGDQITLVALTSTDAEGDAALRARYPRPLDSPEGHAQAMRNRAPLNIADAPSDPRLPEAQQASARLRGFRSMVMVPLLRHDTAIGAIGVSRREPGGFTDDEIALLQTFADQAVIAIENARLLSELQEKNESLSHAHAQVSEALEQQTATSEILKVIASSPTDAQPVFDAIIASAGRLCSVDDGFIVLVEGDALRTVSAIGHAVAQMPVYNARRVRVSRESVVGRAIIDRTTLHIADLAEVSEAELPEGRALQRVLGHRTQLVAPLLREGVAIGAILLSRFEVRLFSERQIELLKTFADQAVIAIENVRLFTELQASNRELTTALDTQTATSDILRVISRSQTDVQPVFDAILASAVRLLGAFSGGLTRLVGDQIELVALTRTDAAGEAVPSSAPRALHSGEPHAQTIRSRSPLNVADSHTDPRLPEASHAYARARGFRSAVMVPMLRHDEAIGTISVTRREAGGFTDDEIALLQTFADQAVIAIENARLLSELQARTQELTHSVEQLTALGDVGRAVSSSLDLDTVLTTIVGRAVQLSGTDGGTIFEYDEGTEEFSARATLNPDEGQSAMLRATRLRRGEGAVGQMAVTREPLQIPDISAEGAYEGRLRGAMLAAGTRSVLAIPLLHEDRLVGGLVVTRRAPGAFSTEVVELLRTFATQSALAIQNARLFRELEIKSRELEVASQHKSEFLASMSHELRTPLNAIIGFSDVLLQGMFGETNEKQTDYLRDILASGQHLLSLINDILDLSKIEAGRMELDVADFHLPSAIDDALLLMRERASRRGITLERHVDEHLGEIRADQRKVKQVLLNLLSNAVKFTPEGGRIAVRAALANGTAEIAVTDTGVGIAPEDHEAVFEEFRQVGAFDKKAEGTGLGLALCRKFVELHGGRIWVKSQIGAGSTFTFTLPLRQ